MWTKKVFDWGWIQVTTEVGSFFFFFPPQSAIVVFNIELMTLSGEIQKKKLERIAAMTCVAVLPASAYFVPWLKRRSRALRM